MQRLVAAGAMLAAAALAYPATLNGFDLTGALVPIEAIHQGGPPRDGIPSIDRPKFVSAQDARYLGPHDRILGVSRNGITRAYPISILNWHEVVNDIFGKEPIVVTFCPLCGTGMVFSAAVEGRPLKFGVSGLLYNSDVLLYDRQTNSLWSQIASKAITGPMKGKALESVAASHTTWSDWRARHPQTTVLSAETGFSRDYARDPYAGYAREEQLMFPVRFSSRRYHPKEQVIGVSLDGQRKAYPFLELARADQAFDDTIGRKRVRVEFDAVHRTGRIRDAAGREIPSVIAFWFAWYAFHPNTEVFVAPDAAAPKERRGATAR
jgi:hypothetical protein